MIVGGIKDVGKLTVGVNDLKTNYPELVKQWSENNEKGPECYSSFSNKKVEWVCEEGHYWFAAIAARHRAGCPYCSGKKPIEGVNDFKTLYPELAKQWSHNNKKKATEVTGKSGYRALWICGEGHEWDMSVATRANGQNCPYCSGRRRTEDNSLYHTHPDLMSEWSPDNTINPKKISPGSKHTVMWVCTEGHEWSSSVSNRTILGNNCPFCSGFYPIKGETDFATLFPEYVSQWSKKNTRNPDEVTRGSGYRAIWVCSEGHEWDTKVADRSIYRTDCPMCYKPSKYETEIQSLLGVHTDMVTNTRKVIPPLELDIYIPSKNIAIEFNGLYWHSEAAGKDKWYHYNKWKACADQGIQLITIWEDDWIRNPELVKRMLLNKLGDSVGTTIYARKTTVSPITKEQSRPFLSENHIQGATRASVHLGMYHKDDLIAVMLLTRTETEWTLDRYATSCSIPGGHSKMLEYFKNNYIWSEIKTFADLCVSNGGLYEKTGWTRDALLKPDYRYAYRSTRIHKFNFRHNRFKNDHNLLYEEGLTEKELAKLNGLHRIWDCGKIRYKMRNDNA